MGKPKRASYSQTTVRTSDTNTVQLLGPNPRRVGIVLSATDDGTYGVGWDNSVTGWHNFPIRFLSSNGTPVTLCCCDYGTVLQMPLYVAGSDSFDVCVGEILSDNPEDWN